MIIIDIILVLVLFYIIINIINGQSNMIKENDLDLDLSTNMLSNNIVFDDDIIIINNKDNNNENENNNKDNNNENENKSNISNFNNKEENNINNTIKMNNKINNLVSNSNIYKIVDEIYELPTNTINKQLADNNKKTNLNVENELEILEKNNMDNTSKLLPNNEGRVNNRYNRKYNNIPYEDDLYNIRQYNIKNLINDDEYNTNTIINKNNLLISKFDNNIDSKIFNKSNKSQKLFKDTKTIANRFNKNSIINDYKYELDYYSKLKTPWWEENLD